MSNKNTANTNETVTNNGATLPDAKEMEVLHSAQHAVNEAVKKETAEADNMIAEVVKAGKLQAVKVSLRRRSWADITGAGLIAAVGSVGDMVLTNKLNANLHGDDAEQYTSLEIAGVGAATALIASTLRFGLDFVPVANNNLIGSVVATSLVGNCTFVASAYARDAALNMIKGRLSVNVETLAE